MGIIFYIENNLVWLRIPRLFEAIVPEHDGAGASPRRWDRNGIALPGPSVQSFLLKISFDMEYSNKIG